MILKEAVACIAIRAEHPRPAPQTHERNTVRRVKFREAPIAQIGASGKALRNLYSAFIEQNLNASRILIVEGASDPAQTRPGPEEREPPSRDNAQVLAILVWVSGVSI